MAFPFICAWVLVLRGKHIFLCSGWRSERERKVHLDTLAGKDLLKCVHVDRAISHFPVECESAEFHKRLCPPFWLVTNCILRDLIARCQQVNCVQLLQVTRMVWNLKIYPACAHIGKLSQQRPNWHNKEWTVITETELTQQRSHSVVSSVMLVEYKASIVECNCKWEVVQVCMQGVMCLILIEPIEFEPYSLVWVFVESWPECPDIFFSPSCSFYRK